MGSAGAHDMDARAYRELVLAELAARRERLGARERELAELAAEAAKARGGSVTDAEALRDRDARRSALEVRRRSIENDLQEARDEVRRAEERLSMIEEELRDGSVEEGAA